jgi:hypothetical protein
MTGRDWTHGEPWGNDSYEERCKACGTLNEVAVPEGPPGGDETFSANCAKCGAGLDPVTGFGPPSVRSVKASRRNR